MSGGLTPVEGRAKPGRGWQFWVAIAGLVVAVLTIVVMALTQGPIHDLIWASKPKLEGRILFSSIGEPLGEPPGSPAYGYPGSLVLVVHLESRHETPVVPVAYKLQMLINDEVVGGRALDFQGVIPITFFGADSTAVLGKPGTWTACIPRSRSLLSPQHIHVPIARDKPIDGLIRFVTPVGPDQMRAWKGMRLMVLGADGTEYSIHEQETRLGVGVFRRLEPEIKFVPGLGCGDPEPASASRPASAAVR